MLKNRRPLKNCGCFWNLPVSDSPNIHRAFMMPCSFGHGCLCSLWYTIECYQSLWLTLTKTSYVYESQCIRLKMWIVICLFIRNQSQIALKGASLAPQSNRGLVHCGGSSLKYLLLSPPGLVPYMISPKSGARRHHVNPTIFNLVVDGSKNILLYMV